MSVASPPRDPPRPAPERPASWGQTAARLAWLGLPALATLVLALGGGEQDGDWYPWAFLTTLGAGLLLALDLLRPRRGPGSLAAVGFGALALWTIASTGWALLPGQAFVEGARTTFYAATFAVVLTSVRHRRDAVTVVALLAAVCGALAAFAAVRVAVEPPASWIVYDRYAWPTGYPNTAASLAVLALGLAAGAAATRRAPILVRAAAQGTCVLAGGLVVLSESRGAFYALLLAGPLALCLVRERLRLLLPLLVAALAGLPAVPALHHALLVDGAGPMRHAARVVLAAAAVAAVAGGLVALADRRLELSGERRRRIGQLALAAVVLLAIAGSAVALATDLPQRGEDAWHTFARAGTPTATGSGVRFFSFGSNRYDFWRVAAGDARRHPLSGVGAGSFGPTYLQRGDSDETPAQAHGEIFELLGTLGLPGALLAAAVALTGLYGLCGGLPGARRGGGSEPLLAGAFLAAACVLVHAEADWHWQSSAVSVPLVALLAAGAALLGRPAPWSGRATRLAGAALVALALVWVLPGLLAVRVEQQAVANADVGSARLASRLNPFGSRVLLEAAALEQARGQTQRARRDARAATRREPDNWATWQALARIVSGPEQRAACSRARALDHGLERCP